MWSTKFSYIAAKAAVLSNLHYDMAIVPRMIPSDRRTTFHNILILTIGKKCTTYCNFILWNKCSRYTSLFHTTQQHCPHLHTDPSNSRIFPFKRIFCSIWPCTTAHTKRRPSIRRFWRPWTSVHQSLNLGRVKKNSHHCHAIQMDVRFSSP